MSQNFTFVQHSKGLSHFYYKLLIIKSAITDGHFNHRIELENSQEIVTKSGFANQPDLYLLLNRVRMKAWFLQDKVFKLPKSFLYLKFASGCASATPRDSILTHLLVLLIQVKVSIVKINKQ
jgi:hypothetical protein